MTRAARIALGGGLVLLVPTLAVAVLAATGSVGTPELPGLPDSGALTRWGLPAARGLRDAAAALTIGLLVLTATVLPPEPGTPRGALGAVRARAVRLAAAAGTGWALSGAAVLAFTYADAAGVSAFGPGTGEQVLSFARTFDLGRSLAASVLLAAVAATGSWLATRTTTVGVLTLVALAALLPLALTGHAAGTANHEAAVDTQAAHLIGVTVWVGGLAGLAIFRSALGNRFAVAARRYSSLAGWCFGLVAVSGVANAAVRVGGWTGLFSTYGALLAAKTLALLLLGAAGWWQRRRILGALGAGGSSGRAFVRLAAAELLIMAVATGLAVALARTSPPLGAPEPKTLTESLLGYPMPPPLGAAEWITQWRIDPLWVPLAVLAAGWYLTSVVRLRRRGDHWPLGRAVSWIGGCVLMVWATSGGPGVYGRVLFSMHMAQHMTIAMAVPAFLALGAPISLATRTLPARRDGSRGLREWLLSLVHSRLFHLLARPAVAAVLFVGSLVVFYYSPLFELALANHAGHVLMNIHFLLVGYLFAWVICGPDPGPARPPYFLRLVLLMATFGFHAFFGVTMMGSVEIFGKSWFAGLDRDWGPTLAEEQYLGGAFAWGLADYPIAILAMAMSWAWIKSDERESRRYDRQADRNGDAALAAYNTHLRRLAERTGAADPKNAEHR